jgi:hypothetical protein
LSAFLIAGNSHVIDILLDVDGVDTAIRDRAGRTTLHHPIERDRLNLARKAIDYFCPIKPIIQAGRRWTAQF